MGTGSSELHYSRDIAEMKERILELQEQAAMAEVEIKQLRQQVVALEKRLAESSQTTVMSPPAVPPSGAGDSAVGSTTESRSIGVEESDLDLSATTESGSSGRLPEAAEGGGSGEFRGTTGAPGARDTPRQTAGEGVEPAAQALYDRGYTLFHQQKYLDAEASFQRFLQAYPRTDLSDNALFWIGESRYQRGDIQGALAAFRETIRDFPQGNKIPDAMIKEGDCLARLGDRDGARSIYQEVRRRFPSAAASIVAEERLSGLD